MRCLLAAGLTALVSLALLAPAAIAHDGGQGLYGETDDKVVTNAGFILIIFFPLFILLMSLLQARLDKRKEARKAAHQAGEASGEPRGGW
jgi:preprotein translocase subunit SecG